MGENKNKRSRTECLQDLDDSMQSLVSDFKTKPNRSMDDLFDFMTSYIEKSEDYRRTVCEIDHQHQVLQKRVDTIEKTLEDNEKKQTEVVEHFEVVDGDVKKMKKAALENEASLHRLEQKQVDKHVYIAGLPEKPDENEMVESLLKIYGMPKDCVDFSYTFQFTAKHDRPNKTSTPGPSSQRSKTSYQMVVAFKDQTSKAKFMREKISKGPLLYKQLTSKQLKTDDAETVIRCVNRLSRFNLMVQRELLGAKNQGEINSFQLHNGAFRLRTEEKSPWKIIDTEEALKPYMKPKDDQRKQKF